MKTTIEARKQKATELLKELDICKPYIEGFVNENKVCFFEQYAGYWVDQEPEVEKKMKELEKRYNCTVYAITHEYLEFGECYSFLLVTDYKCEWKTLVESMGNNRFYAFSYVWNKDYEYDSEFGSIGVKAWGGGICRVG